MTFRSKHSRSSGRPLRLAAAVAAAALVLAACNGDDNDEPEVVEDDVETDVDDTDVDDTDADVDDTDVDDADNDDADNGDADNGDDENGGEDSSSNGEIDDVMSQLENLDPQPSQVTYEASGEGESGTMVIATDPPLTASLMDEDIHTIVDEDDDSVTSCMRGVMGGDEWTCQLMEGVTEDAEAMLDELDVSDLDEIERPDRVSEDNIAGRDAVCLEYDDIGGFGPSTTCIDLDLGAMLSTETGGFTLTATEVETDVDSSLFDPPAEPEVFDPEDMFGDMDLDDMDDDAFDEQELEDLMQELEGLG